MIPMNEYFLTEGVWSFIKNSIANLFGRRRSVNVKSLDFDAGEKVKHQQAIQRRLTPKPTVTTRQKLGFKEIT